MNRIALGLVVTLCALLDRAAPAGPRPRPAPDELAHVAAARRLLRVCADPNNFPFSDDHSAGFENKLAELVAQALDADLAYTWRPQRRGFLRETLKARTCDVVMGIPSVLERVRVTRPYYRSTYVFVLGANAPPIRSLDAPALHHMRIGVPLVGDDGANPPPVLALAPRGLIDNLRGYSVYGDYGAESPPADLLRALRAGDIDVAIAWGPLGGYYASHGEPRLRVIPIPESEAPPGFTFTFDISMGVRPGDSVLASELDGVLARRKAAVDAILRAYGVPCL